MRVVFPCKACGRDITAEYTRPGKTAQCPGCHTTQEIPGNAGAPQYNAGKPAEAPAKGGGSGKLLVIIILLAAAAAAAWFLKGRLF